MTKNVRLYAFLRLKGLKGILTSYDELLATLNERGARKAFADPEKTGRPIVQRCDGIADTIEKGLETIFLTIQFLRRTLENTVYFRKEVTDD